MNPRPGRTGSLEKGASNPVGNTISFDYQLDEITGGRKLPEGTFGVRRYIKTRIDVAKADQGGQGGVFEWGFALHSEI
ncbi:MAG: hypothetical protein BGO21_13055 [Dyadobacter sp. 50-39]|nr:MAG: hypothetical protein BGO21_13055 [Dyadobacter sp. 50-39]